MSFDELKARQAQVWGSGPFEKIAEISTLPYDDLVGSLAPQQGELHRSFADFHESYRVDGGIRMERRYLVTTGTRR